MSALSTVFTACPDMQAYLIDRWQTGAMIGADDRMPFMQFITDPINRQGITTDILPGQGKVRTVNLVYMQRLPESEVNTNQPNPNCTQGDDQGDLSTSYTIDTSVNLQSPGFTFDAEQLENVCRDNPALFGQLVDRDMDALRRRAASQTANQAVALTGGWGNTIPAGTIPGTIQSNQLIIRTRNADGSIYADGWIDMANSLQDSGMGENVGIFGGTAGRNWFQRSGSGCCADEGLDMGSLFARFGHFYAHDLRVQTALSTNGANEMLIVRPGALQLLNYTRSPWKAGLPPQVDFSANYFHGVVADPMTGLLYDWTVKDDCGSIISNLTFTGKLIGLPADMFVTGDAYEGITGVTQAKVVNP